MLQFKKKQTKIRENERINIIKVSFMRINKNSKIFKKNLSDALFTFIMQPS